MHKYHITKEIIKSLEFEKFCHLVNLIIKNKKIICILSSNKGIFCMTNMTGSKLFIFSHPGKTTGYWITTRSFPYRSPYWPIWTSTLSQANMGVSFLDVGSM